MSDGAFSTVLSAPFGPTDLVAQIADDPTVVVASPAYFSIESGTGTSVVRERVLFDDAFTATALATTGLDRRYLAGSTASEGLTHPAGAVVRMVRVPSVPLTHWCSDQQRVDAALAAGLNGIEYVEVIDDGARIEVHLLTAAPGLSASQFSIEGGDVVTDITVSAAVVAGEVWTIDVDRVGDHSNYRLRVVNAGASGAEVSGPPPGFDPVLSVIDLRFHVDAASRFDCRHDVVCPPEVRKPPAIDYLAKDYASFRRVMLDRLALQLDLDADPNAADLLSTLAETIAYRADQLSYYQDAVGTETYLGTARRRESIRRHARMLDYRLAEGCNARVWISVTVGGPNESGVTLTLPGPDRALAGQPLPFGHDPVGEPGTRFVVGVPDHDRVSSTEVDELVADGALVFESLHDLTARSAHNRLRIHTWGDDECCLPAGATRATLVGDPLDDPIQLEAGDVVVFEEVLGPQTGVPADADPAKRHAVRLVGVDPVVDPADPASKLATIRWHALDALPFALCVSARIELPNGEVRLVGDLTVVRGNVVLADHGYRTVEADDPTTPFAFEGLAPVGDAPAHLGYRATLRAGDLTIAAPYDHEAALDTSATVVIATDWRAALPAAWLRTGNDTWRPRPDLLASDRFAREFTVEMTDDRRAVVRTGDNVYGRAPEPGDTPTAVYRIGNGTSGNVGYDTITTIVADGPTEVAVRNPLPASGGRAPEDVAVARRDAPVAFRVQQRAVTTDDYAEIAERHPDVVRAAASRRWTGSWHTMYVTVDRRGGGAIDTAFEADLRRHLERFRLSGHDVEVDGPRFVPLDVAFTVHVVDGFVASDVERAVLERLSARRLADGELGFFHPDRFTFGQPVYLSRLLAVVGGVPGVEWVDLGSDPATGHRFDRLVEPSGTAIDDGVIDIGRLEIARLDADIDHPDRGRLRVLVEAGS